MPLTIRRTDAEIRVWHEEAARTGAAVMRRNVKIALLLSCAWMFACVYYYHTSRDTKVRRHLCQLVLVRDEISERVGMMR